MNELPGDPPGGYDEPGGAAELPPGFIPVDLRDDGVLWAINRTLFHPRGFALAVDPTDGTLSLTGDGAEPFVYALAGGGLPGSEDDLFARFEALLDRARTANRSKP